MRIPIYFWLGAATLCALGCMSQPAAPTASAATKKPAGAKPGVAEMQRSNVSQLYMQNCGNCHGEKGEGGGAGTQTLLTPTLFGQDFDKRFYDAVKNGVPNTGMEAFSGSLTEAQMWSLVVHVKELQRDYINSVDHGPQPDAQGVYKTQHLNYRLQTLIDENAGLRTPWAMTWLPDGTALVTNRPGFMCVIKNNQIVSQVDGLPKSIEKGEGGMMDVVAHPDYAQNHWIYLSYNEPKQGDPSNFHTKLVRGQITFSGNSATWHDQQTIYEAPQQYYIPNAYHFGSRILFDGKGHLFFGEGERGVDKSAQDVTTPEGKIFRLNDDGTAPIDNPFYRQAGEAPKVWTYGNRNTQGMTYDLQGNVWEVEHGPRGGDELDLVEKGKNYGWPTVTAGINYNNTPWSTPWPAHGEDFVAPVQTWVPSIATCGLACMQGQPFAAWDGDLMVGGLAGKIVERVRIKDGKVAELEPILKNIGRIRDVRLAPDNTLYVIVNQPDKIIRLVPAN